MGPLNLGLRVKSVIAGLAALGLAANLFPAPVTVQLRVVDGDGAVYPVGGRATKGVTVQVTDQAGKPVEGAAVSFRLPEDGPSGQFPSGKRTEVVNTNADGRASIWGMQWNRDPGPLELRITAVKDQARAGIVSTQYLTDVLQPKAGGSGTFQPSHHFFNKWVVIGIVAAGAGAGLALAHPHSSTAPPPVVPPSVGTPTISIGKP